MHFSHERGSRVLTACLVMSLGTLGPRPAAAQELAIVEASGGYAFSHDLSIGENLPAGWFLDVGWPATRRLTWFGELASHRQAKELGNLRAFRTDLHLRTVLFGARMSQPLGESFAVFARGSTGIMRFTNHTYETSPSLGDPLSFDVLLTITAPAVQLGGGLDVGVSNRISVRTMVEYRITFARRIETLRLRDEEDIRITTGLAVGIGSR